MAGPDTWTTWTTASNTSTYVDTSSTWTTWTASDTTASIGSTHVIWRTWTTGNTNATYTVTTSEPWGLWIADLEGSGTTTWVVDDAAIRAEQERLRLAAEEAQRTREEARRKARALLESLLDHQQREQLQRERFFEVIARASRRRYRVHAHSYSRNIQQVDDDGKHVRWLCVHPNDHRIPVEDHLVMQRLLLEHQEEDVLRVANVS